MTQTALFLSSARRDAGCARKAGLALAAAVLALAAGGQASAQKGLDAFARHASGSAVKIDYAAWDGLLRRHVVTAPGAVNSVDYAAWKASPDRATLKAVIKNLEAADPVTLDRPEQFAFWANLYNAKTIDVILDAYPVKSIKDINLGGGLAAAVTGGPWKAKTLKVAGEALSLDDIEHGILRPFFKDPRVHYAVNCASIGCPNLMPEAFTGEKLEAQLDAAAGAYVNHPRGVKVTGRAVRASSIYDWFQADFGGDESGVLAHLRKHAAPELAATLKGIESIDGYDYDWRLNGVKN